MLSSRIRYYASTVDFLLILKIWSRSDVLLGQQRFVTVLYFANSEKIPDGGLLCDLLWADPDAETTGWSENDRGVSFTFGGDVVENFLKRHEFDLIVRAHQVCFIADFLLTL